jgi:putative flippase GtrA
MSSGTESGYAELTIFATLFGMKNLIISVIDFFYPPFRKLMPLQTFRYAACGGGNTLLGLMVYSLSFRYILKEQDLNLGFYAFKAHIAALIFSFSINFPLGFILMKYVVFDESNIRGRIQLFRYFIFFVFCLFLNYILLKLLVEALNWYAIVAQVVTTVIVVCVSYLTQKHFTFKVERKEENFPF